MVIAAFSRWEIRHQIIKSEIVERIRDDADSDGSEIKIVDWTRLPPHYCELLQNAAKCKTHRVHLAHNN